MSKVGKTVLGLFVAALLSAGGYVASQRALGPRVAVLRPVRRALIQTVVASGRVLPAAEVNLGAMVTATVRAVLVREGDRVTTGQTLIDFEDAEVEAQVAQARAGVLQAAARIGQLRQVSALVATQSVRAAQANLQNAERTLARQEQLFAGHAVAQADLDNARHDVDVGRTQLQSAQLQAAGSAEGGSDSRLSHAGRVQAEAALRAAEARHAQMQIRAPMNGVILHRSVEPGDVVQPARTLMVMLGDGATDLSIAPDERNLAYLRPGQHATASSEAFPDLTFPAEVRYIAPAIDSQRGTVEVQLRVSSPPPYLRPEMTVSVEIEVARSENALTIPADAVRDAGTRAPWVLIIGPDGRTARADVRLGVRGENLVEVLSGIHETDRVVAASAPPTLGVGRRVRPQLIVTPNGARTAAAAARR